MSETRESPLPGQVYQTVQDFTSYEAREGRFNTTNLEEAQVITSIPEVRYGLGLNKLILDIDLPAKLIPSSTEGHFHLYVDKVIPHHKWVALLEALAEAEIIEPGYMRASVARGFTAVRLPWVKKEIKKEIKA